MVSDDDCAARAFAARRLLREAAANAEGGEGGLPAGFLETINADDPVVREEVVAGARDRLTRVGLPTAEEVADSLVGDLIAARAH